MEDDAYLCDRAGSKKYRRKKLLGTGGFAKCFEVEKLDDHQTYAAKVIPKKSINEKRQRYKLLLEIKLHKSLVHEGIVGFRDVFEDAENIYIILEYCPMDTLKKLVKRRKRLTEFEVKVYTLQMVRAVMFIHQHNVIHRDLKLGNILISEDMHIKICDFGLSTRIRSVGEKRKTVCGTPNYIAPEVLEEQGHSYEVDIWSLGVIIYTLLVGKPPYEDDSVESTYDNIRNNRYSFPNLDISEQARDLIEKILVLEPDRRLSLEDILSHEFLQPLESLQTLLPKYTIAIPPHSLRKVIRPNMISLEQHLSTEEIQDQLPHRSLTIDKSIIIKHSEQESSHSIDEIDFSLNKRKTRVIKDCGFLVYVRECLVSGGDAGFLLSNGIMGIHFERDHTSLILEYDQKYFVYIEHTDRQKYTTVKYNVGILDAIVKDKYLKFTHFMNYFKMKYFNDQFEDMRKRYRDQQLQLVFVRKMLVLGDELLLRLSNSIIELQLKDMSLVFMAASIQSHRFYVDRHGEQSAYEVQQLGRVPEQHTAKKLKRFENYYQRLSKQRRNVQQFRLSIA